MNNLINLARHIPSPDAGLTVAYTPVRLPMEGRTPLELRITAPAVGESLPIILLSHGFVCGDADDPNFTTRGPEWHADAFHDGPGADALVTLHGVGHGLGGIAGLDARETETEEPDVLEATKRLTLAWLQTTLAVDGHAWSETCAALRGEAGALATVSPRTSGSVVR